MSSLKKCLFMSLPIYFFDFFFFILSYMSCLCILEMNSLTAASFENTFSHSKDCLAYGFLMSFRLAYGFLWCAKAFKFNYILFIYFCFHFH